MICGGLTDCVGGGGVVGSAVFVGGGSVAVVGVQLMSASKMKAATVDILRKVGATRQCQTRLSFTSVRCSV